MKKLFAVKMFLLFCVFASLHFAQPHNPVDNEYIITASYYPWYYPARWNYVECAAGQLRTNLIPSQPPALGFYSSADHGVIDKHIEWCSESGINNLMIEWIQPGDYIDTVLKRHILQSPRINDITFSFLYDWAIVFGNFTVTDARITKAVNDFNYLADTYFSHPRFLKVMNGRPVVFIYVTRALTPANMVQKLSASLRTAMQAKGYDIYLVGDEYFFLSQAQPAKLQHWDAIFGYDVYASKGGYPDSTGYLTTISSSQTSYKQTAASTTVLGRTSKVAFIPSCMPGFNDRAIRRTCENHPALARRKSKTAAEGSMFRTAFSEISFANIDTSLNMISITSFNEWHEDTQLEPTAVTAATALDNSTTGTQYTQGILHEGYGTLYLDIIRDKVIAAAGSIRGNGTAVAGATITVSDSAAVTPLFQKTSFSTGTFVLSRRMMKAGKTYRLTVSAQGYVPQTKYITPAADRTATGIDFNLTPTGVETETNIPESIELFQNFPNPFNPGTRIRYKVKGTRDEGRGKESRGQGTGGEGRGKESGGQGTGGEGEAASWGEGIVSLKVYNILGREVAVLVSQEQPQGEYEVSFDGASLPSGVYICELRAHGAAKRVAMLLLR